MRREQVIRAALHAAASLCIALSTSAAAQTHRIGPWIVEAVDGGKIMIASTANDSGAEFGQACFSNNGKCVWMLINDILCNENSRYPVLVNTDAGASGHEVICTKLGNGYGYAFAEFDAANTVALSGATRIGIAFPMQNGLFQVNRFSLDRASEAVTTMRSAAERASMQSRQAPRDEVF